LKKKYPWFFGKDRDQLTPEERRWKWVKEENWPEDLKEFIASKKKTKDVKVRRIKDDNENAGDDIEFITSVKVRDDL